MTLSAGVALGDLLHRLRPVLLVADDSAVDPDRVVRSVIFHESAEPGLAPPDVADALVLVPVLTDRPRDLLTELARGGAAAVLLRESTSAEVERAVAAASSRELPVLWLKREDSWLHVVRLASALLDGWQDLLPAGRAEEPPLQGLFEQANALADSLQAPVTIEDHTCRILAFSDNQDDSDEPRQRTVLGHRVPEVYQEKLARSGALKSVYASPQPVFVDCLGPGTRPRTAIRVRAGEEVLGSIWAVVDRPLSRRQQEMLTEAANSVAVTMLRQRLANDAATQMRRSQLATLLQGGATARDMAGRLGLPGGGTCVVVAHLTEDGQAEAHIATGRERLSAALTTVLRALSPHAVATVLDSTVYALVPCRSGRVTPAEIKDVLERSFVTRRTDAGQHVSVGVGGEVDDPSDLHRSRREAELVLRVLRARGPAAGLGRVSTLPEVHTESLLQRLADVLTSDREQVCSPVARLREYDVASSSSLEATLSAWLDAFGDVQRAAADLHIHPNTLRYRLRRIAEVSGLDLDDPGHRFAAMLQLRLFPG